MKIVAFILSFIIYPVFTFAQRNVNEFLQLQSRPQTYYVHPVTDAITVDGKDNEASWSKVPWTDSFKDIEGSNKPDPAFQTQVKMLWDKENLYVFAKLQEPHIKGYLRQKDTIIYHDNDFEIFLKPNLLSPEYIEIEINALNTVMDLLMTKPYRFGGRANLNWDTKDLESAVYHAGSINNPQDKDEFWTIEMKIPVKSLKYFGEGNQIKLNEIWKINFSRVQWHYDNSETAYSKRKDPNAKTLPEENWVWSPIGLVNMHYPERWGHIKFIDAANQQPIDEQFLAIEKVTWNVFYLQQIYRDNQKRYATSIQELGKLYPEIMNERKNYDIVFSNSNNFYRIEIKSKTQPTLKTTIDSRGNIYF